MRRLIGAVMLVVATGCAYAGSFDGSLVQFDYFNAPLSQVAPTYGEWSKKKVVVGAGVDVPITSRSTERMTVQQALEKIGLAITNAGVEIVELEEGTLTFRRGKNFSDVQTTAAIASPRSVTNSASPDFAELRRRRFLEAQNALTNYTPPRLTNDPGKMSLEEKIEFIRKNLPPP
jgi:hypothetical protein